MSHTSKVDFFAKAKSVGYRVYLYYIATEDPEINNSRVNVRVAQKGHPVEKEIITSRYYRSLQNLKEAVRKTSRSYIFDNSGKQANFIAEITEGEEIVWNDAFPVPSWVETYLLK